MAITTKWEQDLRGCFDETNDYVSRVKNLSLLLNDILGEFEKSVNGNLFISNVGWRVYPEKYPNEKYLQIHDHIKKQDYLNSSHD